MTEEAEHTPNGTTAKEENEVITVRIGRLEHAVEKLTASVNQVIEVNKKQDEEIRWRNVFLKAFGAVTAVFMATTNPETRSAIKAVWETLTKLFLVSIIVLSTSAVMGCANQRNAMFSTFGQAIESGEKVAESACDFAKDPTQFQTCLDGVHKRFADAKSLYSQARTVDEAYTLACTYYQLAPKPLWPLLEKLCQ